MRSVTVTSSDATPIAAIADGQGEPIVLVHGTTSDKGGFVLVTPPLAEHFEVWAYDRRGRGESGDAEAYSMQHEVDDLLAVIETAGGGGPVHVFGHSFGGCCALEAAAQAPDRFRSLTVYEPPFFVARAAEAAQRSVAAADAGDADTALHEFYLNVAACHPDEVALLQSMPPVWEGRRATVSTIGREYDAIVSVGWRPDRYRSLSMPVMGLSGELTGDAVYVTTELRDAIPGARLEVLAGQRHLASLTGPQTVTDPLIDFLGPASS